MVSSSRLESLGFYVTTHEGIDGDKGHELSR